MISKEKATKGDWVLVEFATKRCIKYYAGNIATVLCDEEDGDFVCNFLQKKANNQFIWPEQKDQSIIYLCEPDKNVFIKIKRFDVVQVQGLHLSSMLTLTSLIANFFRRSSEVIFYPFSV